MDDARTLETDAPAQPLTIEELRDALLELVDRNHRLIEQAAPDTWSRPTPCPDLDVRALINHLCTSCTIFVGVAGEPVEPASIGDLVGNDPVGAHARVRERIRELLMDPDVLARPWTLFSREVDTEFGLGIFLLEVAQHGWDLATALDLDRRIDPAIAIDLLERARRQIGAANRKPGGAFGPVVEVHEQVDPSDALAAYLGREL